eukprot:2039516-Pleurochrysis_carterae.AAC.1
MRAIIGAASHAFMLACRRHRRHRRHRLHCSVPAVKRERARCARDNGCLRPASASSSTSTYSGEWARASFCQSWLAQTFTRTAFGNENVRRTRAGVKV